MGDSRQPPGAWLPPAPAVDGAIDRLAFPTAHPSGHPQNTGVCARRGPGSTGGHRGPAQRQSQACTGCCPGQRAFRAGSRAHSVWGEALRPLVVLCRSV